MMVDGDRDSDNSKKFAKFLVSIICPVKWVPRSLKIVEGYPKWEVCFPTAGEGFNHSESIYTSGSQPF